MKAKRKNIEIKKKLINHVTIKGKKNISEKIIYRSMKTLQTLSKKSSNKILQLSIVFCMPIFKINAITQKKRKKKKQKTKFIPAFISKKVSRISFSIKFIVTAAKKEQKQLFSSILPHELLMIANNKGVANHTKKEIQKQAIVHRYLFKNYRWH
jgi:ribosomal protein S7